METRDKEVVSKSRRTLFKGVVGVGAMAIQPIPSFAFGLGRSEARANSLISVNVGFHGMNQLRSSRALISGNGTRIYQPNLMRFLQNDDHSMSPFGLGGVNGYVFSESDPFNMRDPSGNFAVLSFIIGAIVGTIAGAAINSVSEGIRSSVEGDSFDWTKIVSGAVLGGISGGFGAASIGATKSIKVGLSLADVVVTSSIEFGIDAGTGATLEEAGSSAGIGVVLGLFTLGAGMAAGELTNQARRGHRAMTNVRRQGLGGNGSKAAGKRWALEAFNDPGEAFKGLSMMEVLSGQAEVLDNLTRNMSDRSVGRLRATSRTMRENLDSVYKGRLINKVELANTRINALSIEHANASNLFSRRINTRANWLKMNDIYVDRAAMLRTRDRALRTLKSEYINDYQALMEKYPFMMPR